MDPVNRGTMEDAQGTGVSGVPGSGPFFVFQVSLQGERVVRSMFQCHTCGVTVASGSVLTGLVTGQTLDVCRRIEIEQLIAALDGVPPDKRHVPETAIRSLQMALSEAASQ